MTGAQQQGHLVHGPWWAWCVHCTWAYVHPWLGHLKLSSRHPSEWTQVGLLCLRCTRCFVLPCLCHFKSNWDCVLLAADNLTEGPVLACTL